MSSELAFASVRDLSTKIQRREISSVEVVRAALERTKKLDPVLNSYITITEESSLKQAKTLDEELARGEYHGPLHGVPVSIKDHIDTAGIRTTAGAKSRINNLPQKDAAVVRRIKQAGGVIVGKANMNRYASGESGDNPDFGPIRNPWNPKFSPGGSSGGSGVQVAAGLVPLSIGSDNGGSIRIPAALCGIVGFKPTHGRVSMEGIFPRLYSFDHAGPLTRTVEDSAIALSLIAGHDLGDSTTARKPVDDYLKPLSAGVKGVRIGFDPKYSNFGDPEVLDSYQKVLEKLAAEGAFLEEIRTPAYERFVEIANTMSLCEWAVAGAELYKEAPGDMDPDDVIDFKAGNLIPAAHYIRAAQCRRNLQVEYAQATRKIEIFVAPSYPLSKRAFGRLPELNGRELSFEEAVHYTWPFDLLGLPAMSVPCGFSHDGFPIGVQFVARAFHEELALRIAFTYEQATDWHKRRPNIGV